MEWTSTNGNFESACIGAKSKLPESILTPDFPNVANSYEFSDINQMNGFSAECWLGIINFFVCIFVKFISFIISIQVGPKERPWILVQQKCIFGL